MKRGASREPGVLGPCRTIISPCLRAASIEVHHSGADHKAIMVLSKQCYCNSAQQGSRSKNTIHFMLRKIDFFNSNVHKPFDMHPCVLRASRFPKFIEKH